MAEKTDVVTGATQLNAAPGPNTFNATPEAESNWRRYEYAKVRGHRVYVHQAARCEGFYLGGGLQWSIEDLAKLRDTGGRPAYEWNEIMPAINSAVGYQIHNRMDIAFLPRGGMADQNMATIRSKVAMQVCDANNFHWKETQVFADGLIEQRGYFDIRMRFDDNVYGDIFIDVLDPRDVIPDPDAKTYEPEGWYDVTVTRWYSLDTIEEYYGKEARSRVQTFIDAEGDWGEMDDAGYRNKFGEDGPTLMMWDSFLDDVGARHYRILDRQRWVYRIVKVMIFPAGDFRDVSEATPEQIAEYQQQGGVLSKRMVRQVRWTVTTRWVTLHDEISPYDEFTVIPYFCYFRRGRTRGMIDNAIGPQEVLNKAVSQFVHILNTTANSGWVVEENSLVNMTTEDLEDEGAKTGLVVVYKQGAAKPEKITGNTVPAGMDRLIEHASAAVRNVTVTDTMRGLEKEEISGIAFQTKQFAAQQGLAIPLDNLARTRNRVATRIDKLMTMFYDNNRVFRITETDPNTGKQLDQKYEINRFDPRTRTFINDMTAGEYDVVISEQPMQVTFENSQFEQAMEMRGKGIGIPDNIIVKHSNLADKAEILDQMQNNAPQPTPIEQAKTALATAQAALAQANADNLKATAVNTRVTSQFGAVQSAQAIANLPAIAPLADKLLESAGFQDQTGGPPVPSPGATPGAAVPPGVPALPPGAGTGIRKNTDPLTPAHPDVGADRGIEGGQR
jgi:hypothetical protein